MIYLCKEIAKADHDLDLKRRRSIKIIEGMTGLKERIDMNEITTINGEIGVRTTEITEIGAEIITMRRAIIVVMTTIIETDTTLTISITIIGRVREVGK